MRALLTSRLLPVLLLIAAIAAPCVNAAEAVKKAGEYDVKAVFLYNFTRFVDWPETAFADSTSPFVIVIVGDDPFGTSLDAAVSGETVRNRKLVIQRVPSSESIPRCHLLFVSRSEKDRLPEISRLVRERPTLVVSDIPRAAERGAMVNLVVQDSVKMEINQSAAEAAGLRISSKLLGLATIVKGDWRSEPRKGAR